MPGRLFHIVLLVSLCSFASSQEAFTVKYFGLTVHPLGDHTAHLQPNRLDDKARFVRNNGVFLGYEKFFFEDIYSVKFIQGIMQDCSNGFASVSHVGIRANLMNTPKHRVYFGIGPTILFRDSWRRFGEEYVASGYFREFHSRRFGDVQWKFVPYGFEFEYDYCFSERNQLSISCTPAIPMAGIFSIGWKHWLNVRNFGDYKIYKPK